MSSMKSYAAIHHQSSQPPFPPGSRANTGTTVKEPFGPINYVVAGPVPPPSSKAQPVNSAGKIPVSEDYPEIIYEMYRDYVHHPDFPFFKDISEATKRKTTPCSTPPLRSTRSSDVSRGPHMVHRTTPWMTRVIVNDSDDKKWLDSLLGMKIGKNHRVDLGPLEVGGSQHLHGRQGVLAMLEGMACHHQVKFRAGKTRQWAQMTVFKLYEHSTNITLKRVVKKKEKECSDEEPIVSEDQANVDLNEGGDVLLEVQLPTDHQGLIASGTSASEDASQLLLATAMYEALAKSQLHKISGRYPHLSVGESSPCDTTILLPETGPWKQGDSKLIVGVLRMLWFHVPFNKINEFYRVLQQAKEAASKGQHVLAEEKWIIGGFALPILPINEYHGLLHPLLNNFLKSLQESLNVVLKGFLQTWTVPAVNVKLGQLNDMYGTYLDRLIARRQMDFKCIIKGLVLDMPDAMHLKAEDKTHVKDEEVTMVDEPLMEQTEESYKELRAGKLKRKHDLMEGDGTGEHEPKVASSSTSGLVQGSDRGSMFAHQK
ncbi:hypothetical protein C8Q72DRAFT_795691 [Fomitopsis betulina]|nr:hypothetical protein C8Q72DRAFT_795691 [Fomitopsis betulina]